MQKLGRAELAMKLLDKAMRLDPPGGASSSGWVTAAMGLLLYWGCVAV